MNKLHVTGGIRKVHNNPPHYTERMLYRIDYGCPC